MHAWLYSAISTEKNYTKFDMTIKYKCTERYWWVLVEFSGIAIIKGNFV